MLIVMALPFMISCSKDDGESNNGGSSGGSNITVVVNDDGKTTNGGIFSAIDDKNFYLDYVKYTVEEGHLVVTGYDKAGFKGIAKIASRITYKGNTYEVLEIAYSAFCRCENLMSLVIPNGVTTIGREAFRDCKGLTSIIIPASIISIFETAFSGCDAIVSVEVDKNNSIYESRDGKTIIEKATDKIIVPCPSIDAVPPSFKEVVISPARPNIGDTVTATLKFISAGKNWYKMEYTWTLSRYAQEPKYYVKGQETSIDIKEPTFTFVVPDTMGMYTLRVNPGTVSASSLFSNGSPFGNASIENTSVTFTVRAEE